MKLSICIPTYNRGAFLEKNLNRLARQIRENNMCNEVEINVSNNGSTDNTSLILSSFGKCNTDICYQYRENHQNMGPDINYIQTMEMSNGEYSILLGDDDFLIDNGIERVLALISEHNDVDIFISNRDEYSDEERYIGRKLFVRDDIEDTTFDFSNKTELGYYLYLCKDVGACLTFISSVIYKTSILKEYGEYDHSLDGTYYSFWFYWWQKLRDGGKLRYIKDPYIKCTISSGNNNFGKGMSRILVEFNGFSKAAQIIFNDPIKQRDFVEVLKASMINKEFISRLATSTSTDIQNLKVSLRKCKWREQEIDELISITSTRYLVFCLVLAKHLWMYKLYLKFHKR